MVTVTLKQHLATLPEASVASQHTWVVPIAKAVPDVGLHTTETPTGQLSVAVAVKLTTALHRPGSLFWVILDGQLMLGGVVSFTVTVAVQVLEAEPSLTVSVTVVFPLGYGPGGDCVTTIGSPSGSNDP